MQAYHQNYHQYLNTFQKFELRVGIHLVVHNKVQGYRLKHYLMGITREILIK